MTSERCCAANKTPFWDLKFITDERAVRNKAYFESFVRVSYELAECERLRAEVTSWNKYESRIDAEMANLRRAYDKTRKALLEATEERGWLADQCNVLHSHMNASPPLGMTGWLEAAIFARENRENKS